MERNTETRIFRRELFLQKREIGITMEMALRMTWPFDCEGAKCQFATRSEEGSCMGYLILRDWTEPLGEVS